MASRYKQLLQQLEDAKVNGDDDKIEIIKQELKVKAWEEWLDSRGKKLSGLPKKAEDMYNYRIRQLDKSIKEYIKTNNLENDLKHYGISIADLLYGK